MSKHNFVESLDHGSKYDVVIYCTWCGKVVWHFNKPETSEQRLQQAIKEPCVYKEDTEATEV